MNKTTFTIKLVSRLISKLTVKVTGKPTAKSFLILPALTLLLLLCACPIDPSKLTPIQQSSNMKSDASETGLVIVFDDSGSMADAAATDKAGNTITKLALARDVIEREFLVRLNLDLNIGLVFLNRRSLNLELAPAKQMIHQESSQLNEALLKLDAAIADGGTPLASSLTEANEMLNADKNLKRRVIVIISDGQSTEWSFIDVLRKTIQDGTEVFAIGYCLDGQGKEMKQILNDHFFEASGNRDSLKDVFSTILKAGLESDQ